MKQMNHYVLITVLNAFGLYILDARHINEQWHKKKAKHNM